jgi:aminomethyltransferase
VVDDIYLYRLGEAVYLMVVNAANIAKDLDHLKALARGFRVEVEDVSEATALLALPGARGGGDPPEPHRGGPLRPQEERRL